MIVLATSAIPNALRGKLTRWLFELEPGIFVGNVSARVRDELWREIEEGRGQGRALLVYPARNEQGLEFRTTGSTWQPYDIEGLTLIMQPQRGTKRSSGNRQSDGVGDGVGDGDGANGGDGNFWVDSEGDGNRRKDPEEGRDQRSEGWSIAARRRRFKNVVERQAHF